MKKSLFAALLVTASFTVSAQNKQADNSDTNPIVPVLKTYVPPDIVAKAVKKYGRVLYCISQVKSANGEPGYIVGLIRNGHLTNEWMEELKIAMHKSNCPVSDI